MSDARINVNLRPRNVAISNINTYRNVAIICFIATLALGAFGGYYHSALYGIGSLGGSGAFGLITLGLYLKYRHLKRAEQTIVPIVVADNKEKAVVEDKPLPVDTSKWVATWIKNPESLKESLASAYDEHRLPGVIQSIVVNYCQADAIFDQDFWTKHVHKDIAIHMNFPLMPDDIDAFMQRSCYLCPDRNIIDTHMLVMIPGKKKSEELISFDERLEYRTKIMDKEREIDDVEKNYLDSQLNGAQVLAASVAVLQNSADVLKSKEAVSQNHVVAQNQSKVEELMQKHKKIEEHQEQLAQEKRRLEGQLTDLTSPLFYRLFIDKDYLEDSAGPKLLLIPRSSIVSGTKAHIDGLGFGPIKLVNTKIHPKLMFFGVIDERLPFYKFLTKNEAFITFNIAKDFVADFSQDLSFVVEEERGYTSAYQFRRDKYGTMKIVNSLSDVVQHVIPKCELDPTSKKAKTINS